MGLFTDIIESIVTELSNAIPDIKFMVSYSNIKKSNPILTPTVAINFEGLNLKQESMGDFICNSSTGEVNGKKASLKVGVRLYYPQKSGGEGCITSFDEICNTLLFGNMSFKPSSIETNSVTYSSTAFAFILDSVMNFDFIVAKETEYSTVNEIIVKGVY